jgi:16S rRNA (cytosine1402-N4)-methyltransferase
VLLDRCLELLAPVLRDDAPALREEAHAPSRGRSAPGPAKVHVDATLGLGGHAEAVLEAHPRIRLIGLDRDPIALARSEQRLRPYRDRIRLVHAVYDELPAVLAELGLDTVDTILFDLGVSSMQLDEPSRGFAYAQDAPLDMRMDPGTALTAEQVVNTYDARDLIRVLRVYGEERFAPRIAAAIVRERAKASITSSLHLANLVRDAIPAAARRTGGHPAKRTFQALRIEVNGELAVLDRAMPAALDALAIGGRIVVMAYQSLEDRIVKRALAARAHSSAPVDLPVELPGTGPSLRLLTRGGEQADEAEVAANPRAASVRLRAAERVDPGMRTGTRKPQALHQPMATPRRGTTKDHTTTSRGDRDQTKGEGR